MKADPAAEPLETQVRAQPDFVVGVGASAGGLKAFQSLLEGLPRQPGTAWLLLQHLDPAHPSLLPRLLEKFSPFPVLEMQEGMPLEGGRVYVCPAGGQCRIDGGRIRLEPLSAQGRRHTIDTLFTSIAASWREHCAALILSGTGNDGLLGAREIKAAGGWVLAQDPLTAEYDAMPRIIIDELLADIVRPPRQLGEELGHLLEITRERHKLPLDREKLNILLEMLENETGFNFRRYKESMLVRRINRRLAANRLDSITDYLLLLKSNPVEAQRLIQDIFITVTGFFRDRGVFEELDKVLRALVEAKEPGQEVRVWSAGCATGEEAYSLAMLLARILDNRRPALPVKIFATDINPASIRAARQGVYSAASVENVPEPLLQKYFEKTAEGHQVSVRLRDMVVFAEHDIMLDAPFSRLDLIVCRNLLIYFNTATQERLLERFHYSLAPGGYLLLGTSENVGKAERLFRLADRGIKLFQRIAVKTASPPEPFPTFTRASAYARRPLESAAEQDLSLQQRMRDLFFGEFSPPAVLVNKRFEVVHLHGRTQPFIGLPEGDVRFDLQSLVLPELRPDLCLLLQQAQHSGKTMKCPPIRLQGREPPSEVVLTVVPQPQPAGHHAGDILVLFDEKPVPPPLPEGDSPARQGHIRRLEEDLAATRDLLRVNMQTLESASQELQSMSEEYQSTTEELQASNEEYQTANEELQSTNEELVSVNEELKTRTVELLRANTELDFILNATLAGILVLDENFQVERHSATCRDLYDLWPGEVTTPLQLLARLRSETPIASRLAEAMASGLPFEFEHALRDRHFTIRLVPVIEPGARAPSRLIVAFYDETERKRREQESQLLAAIVRNSSDAIVVHGMDGRILNWNRGACEIYGYQEEEAIGRHVSSLVAEDGYGLYCDYLDELLSDAKPRPIELRGLDKEGGNLELLASASVLLDHDGKPASIALTQRDITEIKINEHRLNALVESTPDPIIIVEGDGTIQRLNKQVENLFGYTRRELLGKSYKMLIPDRFRPQHDIYHRKYQEKPVMRQMGTGLELWCLTKEGKEIPVEIGLSPVIVRDEITTLVRFRDVRKQKQEQAILQEALQKADDANRTKSRFLAAASHDLRQPLQSISMYLGALAGELGEQEKNRALEQARMALDTTNKLLNALLNITKLESGKVQPEVRAFRVLDLLERVHNTEAPLAREKRQTFSFVPSSASVLSDPALLEQLVTNLVANAVRYTPPGGHILLGCRRKGNVLKLQVSDNGPGIASSAVDVIFDEYRQLEYDGHYHGKGLGLGLSIVKLIAELLNLKLEVKSAPGKGSSFSVFVPLSHEPAPGGETGRRSQSGRGRIEGTILLIEDDPAVMDSTSLFLGLAGLRVLTARDSAEAFAALRRQAPDLIVTDYGLGQDENGIVLVEALRRELGRHVPAIVITGDTSDRRSQEAAEKGCDIVCKPIEAQTLLQTVRKALQQS